MAVQLIRTLMFVPANRENMVARAHQTPADVIMLDLEDSVPLAEKAAARSRLRDAITSLKAAGKTVHVRVNHLDTGLTRDDLEAAIGPGLDGLAFPKTEAASQIRELDVLIRQQEVHHEVRAGTTVLVAHVETSLGLLRCEEVVLASSRIGGLALGGEDYAADLGVPRTRDGHELEHARRVIITAALAHGKQPLDGIFADIEDEAGLSADAEYGRSIGFKGKHVIHPAQVAAVNAAYTPKREEVEAARRLVIAFDEALAQGHASVRIDGRMVDTPVVKKAQALIAYAEAIEAASAG